MTLKAALAVLEEINTSTSDEREDCHDNRSRRQVGGHQLEERDDEAVEHEARNSRQKYAVQNSLEARIGEPVLFLHGNDLIRGYHARTHAGKGCGQNPLAFVRGTPII